MLAIPTVLRGLELPCDIPTCQTHLHTVIGVSEDEYVANYFNSASKPCLQFRIVNSSSPEDIPVSEQNVYREWCKSAVWWWHCLLGGFVLE